MDRNQRQAFRAVVALQRGAQRGEIEHAVAADRQRLHPILGKTPTGKQAGMIGSGDVEPRHANSAAAHLPVRREQRRRRFGGAGGEYDMLGLWR